MNFLKSRGFIAIVFVATLIIILVALLIVFLFMADQASYEAIHF